MSDRQKLVYDLSMQAAVLELQSNPPVGTSYTNALLDAFSGNIAAYSVDLSGNLNDALTALSQF